MYIWGTIPTSVTGYGYLSSSSTNNCGYLSGNTNTVNVSLQTNGRIFCSGEIDVYSDQREQNFYTT